jgi:plastocyanin
MNRQAITLGVLLAVLQLAARFAGPADAVLAGGGCHTPGISEARTTSVALTGSCFAPSVAYVEPGDTVVWTNTDGLEHAVTGAGQSWGSYDTFRQGKSTRQTFRDTGVFPYFCVLHPSMVGVVVVGHPALLKQASGTADELPGGGAGTKAAVLSSDPAPERKGTSLAGVAGIGAGLLVLGLVAGGGLVWRIRSHAAGHQEGRFT